MMFEKKSQQEIVGFIIIVIIVVIISVVFLGMYLKPRGIVSRDDAEISNFLISSTKVTTDCIKGNEPNYRNLGELIEDCFSKRQCLDGRNSCEVLKEGYENLLAKTWSVGARGILGYEMRFYYQEIIENEESEEENFEYGPRQEFLKISDGNSSNYLVKKAGSYPINVGSGEVVAELEIYKG